METTDEETTSQSSNISDTCSVSATDTDDTVSEMSVSSWHAERHTPLRLPMRSDRNMSRETYLRQCLGEHANKFDAFHIAQACGWAYMATTYDYEQLYEMAKICAHIPDLRYRRLGSRTVFHKMIREYRQRHGLVFTAVKHVRC